MSRRCDFTRTGVQTGNNVSHANNRTRRRFLPNIQDTSMLSDALGEMVSIRVAAKAIRTIDKRGGLDAFLLSTSDDKLGPNALKVKRRVRKALKKRQPAA